MSARWLARAAFALMFASAAVLIAFPERHVRGALATVAIGAVAACLIVAGGYWYLAHRGVARQLALGLVVLVPVAVLAVFAWRHVIWVAVVSVALLALAVGAARLALTPAATPAMPCRDVPPPARAFLIINPRPGGGKVARFGLKDKAEALGAEVALLEGPGQVNVAALARKAVAGGADLLAVAAATGPRRWWPASPPSTTCRSW
jgi:hypothetical protein